MKIQLKRSSVLVGGNAKTPTADQLEYGELAINFHTTDPSIFMKDSQNNVVRISGAGSIGSGQVQLPIQSTSPSNPLEGNLYFDTDDNRLYIYNGSAWVRAEPLLTTIADLDITNSLDVSGTANFTSNTGFGVASPSTPIDISNSSNAYIQQTRGSSTFLIGPAGTQASDGAILGTTTAGPLKVFTNGSSNVRLTVDSEGRVGIGVSDLSGYLAAADQLVIKDTSGSAGITIHSDDDDSGYINFADGTSGSERNEGFIEFNQQSKYMSLGTAAAERIQITSTGIVDIKAAGTAAAPALIFEGDTNTGISHAADTLGFSTGGSARLDITSTGVLDIKSGGSSSAPSLIFQGDVNTGISHSADTLVFNTAGNARLTIGSTGDVTIANNLIVQGTTTTIDTATLLVEDKNIELGVVSSPTNTTADGGGITLKSAAGDKTIQWINSTGAWTFNQPVSITGTIASTGTATFGNTSGSYIQLAENTGVTINDGTVDLYQATSTAGSKPFKLQSDVGGTKVEKAFITAAGSATFSGSLDVGGVHNGNRKFSVQSSGEATINTESTGSTKAFTVKTGASSTEVAHITAAGSATFASDIKLIPTSGTAKQTLGSSAVSGGSYTNYHGASGTKTWFVGSNYNVAGALEFWQSTTNGGTTPGANGTQALLLTSTGNAEFGGIVSTTSYLKSTRSGGTDSVLAGYHNSSLGVNIRANGNAEFQGQVIIGGSTALANSTCTINDDGYIFINRSSGNALIVQQNGGGSSSDNKIALGTDGSATFAGSSFGIGTTSPSVNLHVAGTEPQVYIQDSNSTGNNVNATIQFRDSSNAQQAYFGFANTGNTDLYLTNTASSGALQLGTGSTTRLTITSTGNVYVNNPESNSYTNGALISNAGKVASYVSSSTSASDQRLYVYNGSTTSYTANINADGSASFASGNFDLASYGALSIKRTDGNSYPLFRWGTDTNYSGGGIYPDGSATFANYVTSNEGFYVSQTDTPAGNSIFKSWKGAATYVDILDNGSATFASNAQFGAGAADARITIGSHGTAGTNNSVHVRADGANLLFMSGSGGVTKFEQNGTQRLLIDSDGNVIVGASQATNAEFTIRAAAPQLSLYATPGNVSRITLGDTDDWNIGQVYYDNNTNKLHLYTNNDDRMVIDNSGKVGIGTTSPDGTLHVHTGTAGTVTPNSGADDLVVENAGDCGMSLLTADGNNTTALFFGCPTQSVGAAIRYNNSTHVMSLGPDDPDSSTALRINCGDGVEAMRIASDKTVLIGTTTKTSVGVQTPYSFLEVSGNRSGATGAGYVTIKRGENAADLSNGDTIGRLVFTSLNGGDFAYIQSSVDGTPSASAFPSSLRFHTNDGAQAGAPERMRIDSDGNIGIGNVDPSSYGSPKLLVSGADPTLTLMGTGSTNGSSFAGIKFRVAGASGGDYTKSGIFSRRETSYNDLSLIFALNTTADASSVSIADEKMRIDSSGNVGIGKASSLAAKLHIQDDSATETTLIKLRNYKSGVNTQAGLMFECSTSGSQGGNSLIKGVCGTDAGGSNSQNDGGLAFQTGSGGSGTLATSLLLTSTGNAEFGGQVSADSASGAFQASRSDGTGNHVFRGGTSTNNYTSLITAAGAATFAGTVHIGTSTYAGNGQVAIAGNSSGSSAAGILDIRPTLSRPTATNTTLSLIRFGSADHTGNTGYASINMASDGASSSDSDIPGRLEFHTTNDGASSPTEKVRIDKMGRVGINSFSFADSATALLIKNGSAGNEHTMLDIVCNTNETARVRFSEDGSTFPGEIKYETLNHRLLITVNSDERMRIDENGLLSTYGTGNTTNLKLRNSASSSSDIYFIESYQGASSTTAGGNVKFAVATNGGISNVQSNNVDLCDEREKKNIVDLETKWDKVKSWELKKFHYNEDADTDDLRYGVIAQQIETVCPEVLADWHKQRAEDAVLDEDGNVVTPAVSAVIRKGVKEQQMMWMAIKALQEAQARIETLEAKVAALES